MARDRKRAKQRQRRRAGQQQQRSQSQPPTRARVEDAPTPEPAAPDAGEGEIVHRGREEDPNAAPDPLAHSSAEVDIAELAEAAVQEPGAPDGPLEEDEYPHPDELEGADALAEEEEEEAPERGRRVAPGSELPREGNRFVNFLRACVAELRRVQWPDRRQVGQATAVVLVFVLIAGGYLGILDAAFSRLVNLIL